MIVKTNVEGLVKDTQSGAILNVDNAKLQAYKKQKAFMEERNKDGERLNRVENDLTEIKNLLQALLRENDK
jgi:hypothetical protein